MRLICIPLIASSVLASPTAQGQRSPSPYEWVHIDGRKNPELIPEWNIWRSALRIIGGGPIEKDRRLIPLPLQEVLSPKEAALLVREGEGELRRHDECVAKVEKLRLRIGKEKPEIIRAENDQIEMDCRRGTLHARDRVLAGLRGTSRLTVRQWVEALKADVTISVPKKDLQRFRLP